MLNLDLHDGSWWVEILDPRGRALEYAFALAPLHGSLWACTLHKVGAAAAYRIAHERGGFWRCSCKDHECRGPEKRDETECKHVRAARQIAAFDRFLADQHNARALAIQTPEEEFPCPPP